MKKLLITSDSHGASNTICRILKAHPDADALFFLGDGLRDMEYVQFLYPDMPVYSVAGNCDFNAAAPLVGLAPFEGVLFFYTHGNEYFSPHELARTTKARGADVALFGHTHIAMCEELDGVTLFNPGSLLRPRRGEASYGVITVADGKASFEHRLVNDL